MPTRTPTTFEGYYADQGSRAALSVIPQRLCRHGLVPLRGLASRDDVLAFARRIMTLIPHRDSDGDGLTSIRDIGTTAHKEGFAGLGSGELRAHTERSSIPDPPRLMLFVCQQPASNGGEVLLADGQAIYDDLVERHPEAVVELSRPGTAFFGDGGGHLSQVFTQHPGNRVSIRLRQDGLAQFSPMIQRYLPHLFEAIEAHQHSITLEPGQGYLIDNERWLHARAAFTGDRRCLRALGTPLRPLPRGFAVSSTPGQDLARRRS